jgi:hypothetical protein
MLGKQILIWATAILLCAAAVGLLHGLLGVINPLLGSVYFTLLFSAAFSAALAIAVVIGVPVALFYRWRGWTNLIGVLVGGFVIGALPYFLFSLFALSSEGWMDLEQWELVALPGCYGALGAFVFWLTLRIFGEVTPKQGPA